jgi:hypothetical protein
MVKYEIPNYLMAPRVKFKHFTLEQMSHIIDLHNQRLTDLH